MASPFQHYYERIAGSYEWVNRILTLGLDARWRRSLACRARDTHGSGPNWLDVCTGTGQMAETLSRIMPEGVRMYASDFSDAMLKRNAGRKRSSAVCWIMGDTMQLPFMNNRFALVSVAFATRNLATPRAQLDVALKEIFRILEPGGWFFNLETSQPRNRWIRRLFHWYVRLTVRPVGRMLSGSSPGYAYLSHSIRNFCSAQEMSALMKKAGFTRVSYSRYLFGAVALHQARK